MYRLHMVYLGGLEKMHVGVTGQTLHLLLLPISSTLCHSEYLQAPWRYGEDGSKP